jgi:hypothetical protein
MTLEDERHVQLAALCPAGRKSLLIELWSHGLLTGEQVTFWFYVFDLWEV